MNWQRSHEKKRISYYKNASRYLGRIVKKLRNIEGNFANIIELNQDWNGRG